MLVLPTSTVPASLSPATTWASYGATKFASIRDPQVVARPAVISTSLCAMGMPVSGPARPAARAASAAAACASAPARSTVMKALSAPCARSIRSSREVVSSTDDSFFAARAEDSSAMDRRGMRGTAKVACGRSVGACSGRGRLSGSPAVRW